MILSLITKYAPHVHNTVSNYHQAYDSLGVCLLNLILHELIVKMPYLRRMKKREKKRKNRIYKYTLKEVREDRIACTNIRG